MPRVYERITPTFRECLKAAEEKRIKEAADAEARRIKAAQEAEEKRIAAATSVLVAIQQLGEHVHTKQLPCQPTTPVSNLITGDVPIPELEWKMEIQKYTGTTETRFYFTEREIATGMQNIKDYLGFAIAIATVYSRKVTPATNVWQPIYSFHQMQGSYKKDWEKIKVVTP